MVEAFNSMTLLMRVILFIGLGAFGLLCILLYVWMPSDIGDESAKKSKIDFSNTEGK